MMHIHMKSIVEILKFTKGQGHKVKGQGQTYTFVKKLIWQYAMNQWLDMDDTCTYDWYQWDVKVDQGQGHKVKGQGHICDFVLTLYHEPMIGYYWCLYIW